MLQSIQKQPYTPAAGADYPRGRFGDSLQQIAQLIKADVGDGDGVRRYRRLGSSRERTGTARLRKGSWPICCASTARR